jgi:CyaY protein
MTESEFQAFADDALFLIGDALDDCEIDMDWELSDGILTIDLEGGKVIVNRHVPNREIWLASSATGAAHFRYDGQVWRDTRGDGTLGASVVKAVAKQGGAILALDLT